MYGCEFHYIKNKKEYKNPKQLRKNKTDWGKKNQNG